VKGAFRALLPSYTLIPPLPSQRAPANEVLRSRMAVNNYFPHVYVYAHEGAKSYEAGIAEKGLNYAGSTFAGSLAVIYILVPKDLPDKASEMFLSIGLTNEGKKGGEIKQVQKLIKKGEVIITFWDPVTNYRTATKFDKMSNMEPQVFAKAVQMFMEKIPDPRVKEQTRLPLPVPKAGIEYMKGLDPAGYAKAVEDGHIKEKPKKMSKEERKKAKKEKKEKEKKAKEEAEAKKAQEGGDGKEEAYEEASKAEKLQAEADKLLNTGDEGMDAELKRKIEEMGGDASWAGSPNDEL